MPKKFQFILVSFFLCFGFLLEFRLDSGAQPGYVLLMAMAAYLASAAVLRYDLAGWEFLTLLTLPTLFTLSVGAVFIAFPSFSATFRFLVLGLFAFGFYLILLAENIFNVGRERPLPLLKAASTVSFLLTLLTAFLLFTVTYKAGFPLFLQWFLLFLIVFLLGLQSLWTVVLGSKTDRRLLAGSFLLAAAVTELAAALSFLPLESFFRALVLSTGFYVFLGAAFHFLKRTLHGRIFFEYAVVILLVAGVLVVL